jgi:hypothetical protein
MNQAARNVFRRHLGHSIPSPDAALGDGFFAARKTPPGVAWHPHLFEARNVFPPEVLLDALAGKD